MAEEALLAPLQRASFNDAFTKLNTNRIIGIALEIEKKPIRHAIEAVVSYLKTTPGEIRQLEGDILNMVDEMKKGNEEVRYFHFSNQSQCTKQRVEPSTPQTNTETRTLLRKRMVVPLTSESGARQACCSSH